MDLSQDPQQTQRQTINAGYVNDTLIEFKHHFIKQQFSASPFRDPVYGRKVQYTDIIDIPTFTKKKFTYFNKYIENFYTIPEQSIVQ